MSQLAESIKNIMLSVCLYFCLAYWLLFLLAGLILIAPVYAILVAADWVKRKMRPCL